MVEILFSVLLAALVYYVCVLIGLPGIIAILAAALIVVAAFAERGPGPWGGGRYRRW